MTGSDKNNKLNKLADQFFWINSKSYNQVEMIHHIFCRLVDVYVDLYH